jgi:hypothetical protein
MGHFDEKPWISKLEEIGPISVWLVDGAWIRKYDQKEFTNFAQWRHPLFKDIIPENEFWIDQGSGPEEQGLFTEHMWHENYLMGRGLAFKKAEEEATRVEERERHRGNQKFEWNFKRKPLIDAIELRSLGKVGDTEIFLVDGKKVRDHLDPRFCHGGHSQIYDYVPDEHIWIDNTLIPHELPYIIMHESGEYCDMAMGEEYLKAHKKWSRIEWKARHDPEELLRQQKQLGLELI